MFTSGVKLLQGSYPFGYSIAVSVLMAWLAGQPKSQLHFCVARSHPSSKSTFFPAPAAAAALKAGPENLHSLVESVGIGAQCAACLVLPDSLGSQG